MLSVPYCSTFCVCEEQETGFQITLSHLNPCFLLLMKCHNIWASLWHMFSHEPQTGQDSLWIYVCEPVCIHSYSLIFWSYAVDFQRSDMPFIQAKLSYEHPVISHPHTQFVLEALSCLSQRTEISSPFAFVFRYAQFIFVSRGQLTTVRGWWKSHISPSDLDPLATIWSRRWSNLQAHQADLIPPHRPVDNEKIVAEVILEDFFLRRL